MKKIFIVLSFLFLIVLSACSGGSSSDHLGEWHLKSVSTIIGDETITISGGDEFYEPIEIPVSFIVSDGTTELKINNYYGEDAKDIKVGDKLLIRVTVIKMGDSVSLHNPEKIKQTNETIKTLEQILQEAEEMEIPEGRWFIQYEVYTECSVKEITDPYEMKYYPDTLAYLTLNSDGTGTFKTFLVNTNFEGAEYGTFNITWVRYGEVIRITIMGETGVGYISDGILTLEQNSSIEGIGIKEVSTFVRK